jgi:hypothetical protein
MPSHLASLSLGCQTDGKTVYDSIFAAMASTQIYFQSSKKPCLTFNNTLSAAVLRHKEKQ